MCSSSLTAAIRRKFAALDIATVIVRNRILRSLFVATSGNVNGVKKTKNVAVGRIEKLAVISQYAAASGAATIIILSVMFSFRSDFIILLL